MSVEAFVLSGLIEEGSLKKAFQSLVQPSDFVMYEEEWNWLLAQTEQRRPINWRRFQKAFPDFERLSPDERLQDLIEELKLESAYMALTSALEQIVEELTPENTIEQAQFLREVIAQVLRVHSHSSDIILSSDFKEHLAAIKNLQILRANGVAPGIPTGIKTLDAHWGGLQAGRMILVLGRPGDAKSFFQSKLFVEGFLDGRRVGMFSPEMNEHEHRARIATLLTANKRVQEEIGITKAFRNRALMDGHGFNYKTYKRLWEWVDAQPGAMVLFTQKFRRSKMTPSYIESKIDDLGLECIYVDPIYKLNPSERMYRANSWERIQTITDELQGLAESQNVPLVCSNQAHRQMGNKGDAPTKDNSFGSDNPVMEADHVVGVKHITDERKLILRCTKNRFGQDFRVELKFIPNIGIMEDVSFKEPGYYNGHEDGMEDSVKEAVQELEKEMKHDRR